MKPREPQKQNTDQAGPAHRMLERLVETLSRSVDQMDPDIGELEGLVDEARALLELYRTALAAEPPAPDPREALAARPLLEAVARLGDCIGQHTVGEITTISDRAAAWLRENPPGQPVAIEPRGCPTPGACSCVEAPAPADFQTLQGIALDMVESLRPIVLPEILGVLRRAIKQPPAPTPPADGEVGPSEEEWDALVERVWDAHQTIGHQGERFMWDSHFDRAAVMLRDELARWGRLATPTPPVDQKTRELAATVQAAYSAYGWVPEDQFNRLFDEVARVADVIEEGCDCSVQGPLDWQREIEKLKSQANPPSANGEAEELAQWLEDEAVYYEGLSTEASAKATRAAALLRQQSIEGVLTMTEHEALLGWGLIPVVYDAGGGVRIKRIIAEDGDWSVRNSRHINPVAGFPTAAAAWAALQQARGQEVGDE